MSQMKELKPPCYQLVTIDGYRNAVTNDKAYDQDWVYDKTLKSVKQYFSLGSDDSDRWNYLKIIATNNPSPEHPVRLPEPDEDDLFEQIKIAMQLIKEDDYLPDTEASIIFKSSIYRRLIRIEKAAKGKGTYSELESWIQRLEHAELDYNISLPVIEEMRKSLKPEPIGVELKINMCQNYKKDICKEVCEHEYCTFTPTIVNKSVIVKRWIY